MSDDVTKDWLGEPSEAQKPDPLRAARSHGKPVLPKRFYKEAGFAEGTEGFRLTLDGRQANTPARNPLAVPTRGLAGILAAEWGAQGAAIDPAQMPVTRLVNTAIDGVAPRREAVVEDLAAYAGTDLVAYRAASPERLVAAQGEAWDPVLDWARESFRARLILSEGVMHVTQPEETVRALRDAIAAAEGPFRLAALHTMTTLTGSLLIALAVLHGRLDPEAAWAAAHVDETYQASVWGRDAEAEARLALRKAEFEAAARVAALAG
ncbi:ATP12 family chaperone protein [Methylobacterium planeticum]|uniref:ATPase n=1 Tax=Methylobacterium planeticum TaxID=2615211 RepID=A0A6N6MWD9_9HYPH|nr:ATP12 family protein [Methylobacterium planeticum]KAB1074933.1 ATPase [Methylobacterium planeticum]